MTATPPRSRLVTVDPTKTVNHQITCIVHGPVYGLVCTPCAADEMAGVPAAAGHGTTETGGTP